MNILTLAVIGLAITQAITACSTPHERQDSLQSRHKSHAALTSSPTNKLPKQQPPPTENASFPADTLYSLLVAEIAASRQRFDVTLKHYIEQANITQDKTITARAAHIAQFLRAKEEALAMGLQWLAYEPHNIDAITLVANAYIELKQPIKALDYTEKLFENPTIENKDHVAALAETIVNFSRTSDKSTLSTLLQRYKALIQQHPTLTGLKVGISILYQSQELLDEATDWITLALKEAPTKTSAIIQEVLLLQHKQNIELAVERLKDHLTRSPSNHQLRLLYARLLTRTNVKEAYEQFTQLSEQSPNQLDIKFSRALLAIETNKISIAKLLLQELLSASYRTQEAHFYLGHAAEQRQQLDSALRHYQAVTSGSNLLPAQSRIGRILIAQNKISDARNIFHQLRHNHPKKIEQLHINESKLLIQYKHLNTALALLNQAIKQHPNSSDLHYQRATIHEKQDQLELMERDFRNFKMGNIEEALHYLRQAFSLFPDPEVAAHLGEVLWSNGEEKEAKKVWKETLKKHPETHFIEETLERLDISL